MDCGEIAALPGKVTAREITVRPVAPEESLAAMEELAALAPKGYFAGIETTVEDVRGCTRPPCPVVC